MPDTTTYSPATLAWFAENLTDEWAVHVTGSDDILLHENPDLDDDDPANPLLTEKTAHILAENINTLAARLAAEPDPHGLNPQFHATVFHHGVPVGEQVAS